jgi:ABC-2 type transport system permease protein
MILVRLMLRRHRLLIASWSVLLVTLCAVTVSAYQSTYPTPEQRALAVQSAQDNAATTLLYGRLADAGTPPQMYGWEIGAFATVLAAIMAVLLAVAMTRAAEDSGTLELVRSCGLTPATPLRSAFVVLAGVTAILAAGCAVPLGLATGRVDAVTWPGALTFGLVVGLTFLLFGLLGVLAAQIAASAGGARVLGFAGLGLAFALRAAADSRHVGWLNWLSPLALRATVRPFEATRWWTLPLYAVLAAAVARSAIGLHGRRELGAGLLRRHDRRSTRLNVKSGLGLSARLAGPSILTWAIAVTCTGTLFTAMGSGVVEQSRRAHVDGFLGSQLGRRDPLAGYLAYTGIVVGMVVTAYAVLGVLRAKQDEAGGLIDHVLATGARRWQPLLWQMTVTAVGSAVILTLTGACGAVLAPAVFTGNDVALRAFTYPIGQWPATVAAAGWTALLVGRWPRATWLAWFPVAASGFLALLGHLLELPEQARDLSIFTHVPDVGSPRPALGGLGILLAVAIASCLLGIAAIARRDISTT